MSRRATKLDLAKIATLMLERDIAVTALLVARRFVSSELDCRKARYSDNSPDVKEAEVTLAAIDAVVGDAFPSEKP
jgi:hypothetical protein